MQKTKRFIKAVLELALFAALALGMVLLFRLVSAGEGLTLTGGPEDGSTVYPPPRPDTATAYIVAYPPWMTATPFPTRPSGAPPTPTFEPTETIPPFPTLIPTPVVTPIPTAQPPYLDFPPGKKAEPFTLVYRQGDELRAVDSSGANDRLLVDIHAATSLYLGSDPACGVPVWGAASSDGRQLALVLCDSENWLALPKGTIIKYSLYTYDLSTGSLQFLLDGGVGPAWSPDGERISYRGMNSGLWILEVPTGKTWEVYPVDQKRGQYATWFDWSPDGQNVIFIDEVIQESRAVVVASADGSSPARVFVAPSTFWPATPKWSPDGSKIIFMSEEGISSSSERFYKLWMMNSDGSSQVQLTHDIEVDSSGWLPDGRWIYFSGAPAYENPDLLSEYLFTELWLVDQTGLDLKRLTWSRDEKVNTLEPSLSPDGSQIVYTKDRNEACVLSLIDGSSIRLLPVSRDFLVLNGEALR